MPSATTLTSEPTGARAGEAHRLRTLGWVGLVGGLLGALSAGVVLAWPATITPDRYSYPFGAASYTVAQIFFAVQHLTLLAVVAGLGLRARHFRSPLLRVGLVLASLGLLGLTACEVFALTATHASTTSATAAAVNNSFGAPTAVIGLGLVLAGIAAARGRLLPGLARWLPLVLGGYVFVVLFPAVFGPQVAGRLAIGAWMVLFAALGLALARVPDQRR